MDIKKEVYKTLRIMVVWSVVAVLSIPTLILVLVLLTGWLKWVIAIPCILILVISFYGLPIGWSMGYPSKLESVRVINAINSGVLSISDISAMTGQKEKMLIPKIQSLIGGKYLMGYKFNNDKTALEKIEITRKSRKCPNCGGLINDEGVCEYCKARI
jgi:hypothetical protein